MADIRWDEPPPILEYPQTEDSIAAWMNTVRQYTADSFQNLPNEEEMQKFDQGVHAYGRFIEPKNFIHSFNCFEIKSIMCRDFTPPFIRDFFSATVILRMARSYADARGRVSATRLLEISRHAVCAQHWRLTLISAAKDSIVHINHEDLADLLVVHLEYAEWIEKNDFDYVACMSERKFVFFLDPMRIGKYRIEDVVMSGFLQELQSSLTDEAFLPTNWFGAENFRNVLRIFRDLDSSGTGMISEEEMQGAYDHMCPLFLKRLYQQTTVYENSEMDFKAFCDFHLCMTNLDNLSSWKFIFRVMDSDGDGLLSLKDIRQYVSSVLTYLVETRDYKIVDDHEDMVTEVYDMIGKTKSDMISFDDIRVSGYGNWFFRMFTLCDEMVRFDTREQEPKAIEVAFI